MIKKIKLEWYKGDSCFSEFTLNGKKFRLRVWRELFINFYEDGVGLVNNIDFPNFPQSKVFDSMEEGQEFCQQWLDDYIDNLNKKEEELKPYLEEKFWTPKKKAPFVTVGFDDCDDFGMFWTAISIFTTIVMWLLGASDEIHICFELCALLVLFSTPFIRVYEEYCEERGES